MKALTAKDNRPTDPDPVNICYVKLSAMDLGSDVMDLGSDSSVTAVRLRRSGSLPILVVCVEGASGQRLE